MHKHPWPHKYLVTLILIGIFSVSLTTLDRLAEQFDKPATKSGVLAATTGSCTPPYTGVWRTPIPATTNADPKSAQYISTLTGTFGSDVSQFTMPVYRVTNTTPLRTITVSGVFSNVTNNGATLTKTKGAIQVPSPQGAHQAAGSDAQIIFWNQDTGDEWGFWQVAMNADGSGTAVNGYHYNTNWSGVPPTGFGSRGAGVPYLTGLIMPCEIAQGHIDHPIAFAYQSTSPSFVYPATKSDGTAVNGMPEGTHLQLNPTLSDAQIQAFPCTGACFLIAKAMQKYGAIIIDKAGHPKLYAEYEGTAQWGGVIDANTVKNIPYSAFRVISSSAIPSTGPLPTTTVPTVPATGTRIALKVFLHGIGNGGDNASATGGNASPNTTTRSVTLDVFDSTNRLVATLTGQLQYNAPTGSFLGSLNAASLPSGVYTLQLKVPQYLKRTIPGILTVTSGQMVTAPTVSLTTGDVNNDNLVNIIDYNTLLDCFSDLSPARNCSDTTKRQMTDITDDGQVNQYDYNLFLRELSIQFGQ